MVRFRWHDPTNDKAAEFVAEYEQEFENNCFDAAIDFRLASREIVDETIVYKRGELNVYLGTTESGWLSPRIDYDTPSMTIPQCRTDTPCFDAEIIKTSASAWWKYFSKLIKAAAFHNRQKNLKVA